MKKTSITFLLVFMGIINFMCTQKDSKENAVIVQPPSPPKNIAAENKLKLEIKTYQNNEAGKGWGYDIYADGRLYIHQPHIPAIPGNKGFQSKDKAEKAGNFAVYKIRNNIMPPTISVKELDSLGLLNER